MAWRSGLSKVAQELRDFVVSSYVDLKKANPSLPILVREAEGAEARLTARYDFGVEKSVTIQGLDTAAINSKLQELIKAGEGLPRSGE